MSGAIPDRLAKLRSVVILAPHQDDEILGCGNLMKGFTQAQIALTVVWLTDGGAAFGTLSETARAELTSRRQAEALAGLKAMGIACETLFLGHPDGALAQNSEAAVAKIRSIARERAADALFVTDESDGHPDHGAAFSIASQILGPAIYSYPVSARYDGGEPVARRDAIALVANDHESKRRGLACHVSQHEGGRATYPMTASAIDRFCAAPEIFYPIRSKPS